MKKAAAIASAAISALELGLCFVSIAVLTLLPLAGALMRVAFNARMPASSVLIAHFLLVLGLLSGMMATSKQEHLSIGLFHYITNEKIRDALASCTGFLATFTVTILAWASAAFIKVGLSPATMIGFIPDQVFALVMPVGFLAMALRFARLSPLWKRGATRFLPVLALLLGTVCALPSICKLIWGIDMPDGAYALSDAFFSIAWYVKLPALLVLIVAALAGTPLFVVIGALALVMIQASGGEIDAVADEVYRGLTQNSIVSIPLFTLAGFFLSESKAGERLVVTFRSLFGWLPGGMIIATVIICAFFTSFTGASGVTILALGGILYTVLSENASYPEKFSIGLLTASGSIGLFFPPSLPILLVGAATRTNTIHLFLGGIIPGLILVAAMIAMGIVISVKTKIPVEPFKLNNVAPALRASLFEIMLPFLLIVGYFSGLLSMVEIGAAAVFYLFIIEVVVLKDIKLRDIGRVIAKALPIMGGILSILALAQALSYYIVDTQGPERFAHWIQGAISSKVLFLLILNAALLIIGCLIDIFSAILIVLPLITPLGAAYGIDPVHLGIIFLINMEAGFLTPPVGLNLFLASYRFKKPFVETSRSVLPFLLIQLALVFVVTYIPALSTWLTRLY
ncbi:MAG: TRAP transporter large permease subunit [Treponema sp.]|nr:TRAP transporter large permease subunit [Treponema sp.]